MIFYYLKDAQRPNGKIIEKNKAFIKVNDLGLLRGYGVFDYLRTYSRRPFHLDDHLNRFFRSASCLNLEVPVLKKELRQIIFRLLAKNKTLKELSFRLVLTGGETEDGKTSPKPTFFIIVDKPHFYSQKIYKRGVKLVTINYRREFPEIKTINYLLAISQWRDVLKKKAAEILYVWQGKVLEASTANFFIVKNKILFTPKNGILEGVTRKIVIKLAKENKISARGGSAFGGKVREKILTLKEVLKADECFITATDKEIMPVVRIDNHKISSGQPGPITRKLRELFKKSLNTSTG